MRSWWVRLRGRPSDLERLRALFGSGDPNVLEEDGCHFLRAAGFSAWSRLDEVRLHAYRLLTFMNGIACMHAGCYQPVEVQGDIEEWDEGKRHRHVLVAATVALAWAVGGPGRPTTDEAERWLCLAQKDRDVADALRFVAAPDWFNLHKVYEVIKKDVGGEKALQQMAPKLKSELDRFTATANHPSLLGNNARHARMPGSPNITPMALDEARELVWALMAEWLSSKP